MPPRILIKYFATFSPLGYSVMDTIPVSHAGDQGSIPRRGCFTLFSFFCPIFTHFWGFLNPKKGLLYRAIPMGPLPFNQKVRGLLPILMTYSHFFALPRNFNF